MVEPQMRLYCVVLTLSNESDIYRRLNIVQSTSEDSAVGRCVLEFMEEYPEYSLVTPPSIVNITDAARQFVRNHPEEKTNVPDEAGS